MPQSGRYLVAGRLIKPTPTRGQDAIEPVHPDWPEILDPATIGQRKGLAISPTSRDGAVTKLNDPALAR